MFAPLLQSRFGAAFSGLPELAREVDRVVEELSGNGKPVELSTAAPVTLWDDEKHVYLELDVPGFQDGDIELTMQDGRLWIRGERKAPQHQGKCWYNERRYGRFERVISMSDTVDPSSVEAELANGVLCITLSKKPEAQAHRIQITSRTSEPRRLQSESQSN